MLFTFLLVVQFIIASLLVTVILMQRSEGGGLTSGGSPSGLMSARGAADFLTRATAILATMFVAMSILLAVLGANRHSTTVDASLQQAPEVPSTKGDVPVGGGNLSAPFVPAQKGAPTPAGNSSDVPLQ